MKDVIILTGISLFRKESAESWATRALKLTIDSKALAIGMATGALSFFGIMLGFEIFGSVMAMVSLLTLWMSQKGGRK